MNQTSKLAIPQLGSPFNSYQLFFFFPKKTHTNCCRLVYKHAIFTHSKATVVLHGAKIMLP